jgi:hypothetical protein
MRKHFPLYDHLGTKSLSGALYLAPSRRLEVKQQQELILVLRLLITGRKHLVVGAA